MKWFREQFGYWQVFFIKLEAIESVILDRETPMSMTFLSKSQSELYVSSLNSCSRRIADCYYESRFIPGKIRKVIK